MTRATLTTFTATFTAVSFLAAPVAADLTIADLAPRDAIAVVAVDDYAQLREAFDRTGFAALLKEPEMKEWIRTLAPDQQNSLRQSIEELGLEPLAYWRASGASGIDLCGNALVQIPGKLFVLRSGAPNRFPESYPIRAVYRGATSLVARALLLRAESESLSDMDQFIRSRGGALTLGNVILHTGETIDCDCLTYAHRAGLCRQPAVRLVDHERAHVLQYMVLGPLFLPLYLLCGGISVRNRFERAADRYALTGRGWWPWA